MNDVRRAAGLLGSTLVALLLGGCSGSTPDSSALSALLQTEREFATSARAYGMKVAFLRYLDDDAIVFRPHPVNAKRYTSERPDSGVRLSWRPSRVGISNAKDLGWTSGPYRVEPSAPGEDPLYGYFVSVWKRQDDGGWKVVMDLGIESPDDESCGVAIQLEPPAQFTPPDGDVAGEQAALLELERDFSRAATIDGAATAYAGRIGPQTRLFRDGSCPADGPEAINALLAEPPAAVVWEPIQAVIAESRDLAYIYGKLVAPETGYYLRVWQRDESGGWKLQLDVTSPVPPDDPVENG